MSRKKEKTKRLHFKHGAFYYVHIDNSWERLGTDYAEAKRKANLYNDPLSRYGTLSYFLDAFVLFCEKRVTRGDLSQRTYEDYKRDVEPLKLFFGAMLPSDVEPKHVAQYLDLGVENDRPIRANREKACLSACFTWLIRTGEGNIRLNPCAGVRRNKEKKRPRYVEHTEYDSVQKITLRQIRALMALIYRTLQRPEDIILWSRRNIVHKREPDGRIVKVIRNDQNKTEAIVDIAITPEIENILKELLPGGSDTISDMTFIHRDDGKPYTYSGLSSMLRRYIKKAKVEAFGFYDLKGKGATDMWLSGVAMEKIQVLCGHESIKTTEVYVKCRWRGTVQPNQVDII